MNRKHTLFIYRSFLWFYTWMLFSCAEKPSRFLSEDQFKTDLDGLKEANLLKLEQLRKYGVTDESDLRMDFYFVTNDSIKAQKLANELEVQNHHSNRVHSSANDKRLWVTSANSSRVKMDIESLTKWTDTLSRLGYRYDCQFQGWNPVTE